MSFPDNLTDLDTVVAKLKEALSSDQHHIEDLSHQIKEVRGEAKRKQELITVVLGVVSSWQQSDPGKYSDAFFFLDRYRQKRAIAKEFVPQDVRVCKTMAEFNEYRDAQTHPHRWDFIPPWYVLTSISDTAHQECPNCNTSQPLVEHYVQTEDGLYGDEWQKQYLILCLNCNSLTVVSKQLRDKRF